MLFKEFGSDHDFEGQVLVQDELYHVVGVA